MNTKKLLIAAVAVVVGGLLGWIWFSRTSSQGDDPNPQADSLTQTPAAVAHAERRTLGNTLTIAGEFKPFQDVDVHAKVAGYIRTIYVDVGDHVKAGQTLAVLEIPELAAELAGADAAVRRSQEEIRRAQGDLERAKSAHDAAHSACARSRSP